MLALPENGDLMTIKNLLVPVGTILVHLPGHDPNDNPDGWIWELVNKAENWWKRIN